MRWVAAALLLALAFVAGAMLARPRHRAPPPQADVGAEPEGLKAQPMWELRGEDAPDGKRYLARSRLGGPLEVECALSQADNVDSDPVLPRRVVLSAQGEREITVVRGVDPARPARAAIRCEGMPGDPRSRPEDVVYQLPFYPHTAFRLEQGFDGNFSHTDPESRYALDLGVPEGTPVVAARDGVIMQTEEEFRGRGMDLERYGGRANYVRILHADGSMAVYAHLAPHSTLNSVGEKVKAGDLIGKSGNTGYSTGPHLHFAVQVNAGMALRSVPFRMDGVAPVSQP